MLLCSVYVRRRGDLSYTSTIQIIQYLPIQLRPIINTVNNSTFTLLYSIQYPYSVYSYTGIYQCAAYTVVLYSTECSMLIQEYTEMYCDICESWVHIPYTKVLRRVVYEYMVH